MAAPITSDFGRAEVQRQAEECALREREARARKWAHLREKIGTALRQVFTYAVLATIVTLVWTHRDYLQSFCQREYDRMGASRENNANSAPPSHNGLTHQDEINQASQ